MNSELKIEPLNLHWIAGGDPEQDLCVHGGIRITSADEVLLEDESDFALSAAAVCLLRTIWRDHTPESRVCHTLIPHCGHEYILGYRAMLQLGGCPYGMEFWVGHEGEDVLLTLLGPGPSHLARFPASSWRGAVTTFSKGVMSFLDGTDKRPNDEYEGERFRRFMVYWRRLHRAAEYGE
jgi:hypothetical protein